MSNSLKLVAWAAVLVLAGCASSGGATKSEKAAPTAAAKPATTAAPAPAPAATAAPAPAAQAAPAAATTPAVQASGDTGTIVFFRESKFAGAAVSFKVREGQQELGKLSSGTYFVSKLPPGPHAFTVHSEAKDVLNMEIEAGETYYIQGSVSMGFLMGRPNLSPSNAATFESMKAKLEDSAKPK